MYKSLIAAAIIGLSATAASAATVDTFALDVTNAAGTDSTAVLIAGRDYRITISGTFTIGSNLPRHFTDAEFFNIQGAPIDGTSSQEIGVGVDGADIDFGAFNPSNEYSSIITGTGSTVNVFFQDSAYGDNQGSLNVAISAVPLPAGLALMLTGLGALGVARRRQRTA